MFDLSDTLIQQYGGASQLGHLLAQLDNSTGTIFFLLILLPLLCWVYGAWWV